MKKVSEVTYLLGIIVIIFTSCSFGNNRIPVVENVNVDASLEKVTITWTNPPDIDEYSIVIEVTYGGVDENIDLSWFSKEYIFDSTKTDFVIDGFSLMSLPMNFRIYLIDQNLVVSQSVWVDDIWAHYTIPIDEAEPNDDVDSSYSIIENTPYYLTLNDTDDVDWYSFPVKKDRIYSVGIIGGTNDYNSRDTLQIDICREDDTSIYYASWGGGAKVLSNVFTTSYDEDLKLNISNLSGITNDYILYVQSCSVQEDSFEPNNEKSMVTPIQIGNVIDVSIHNSTDVDFYSFQGIAGQTYFLNTGYGEDSTNYFLTDSYENGGPKIKLFPSNLSAPYNAFSKHDLLWNCLNTGTYIIMTDDYSIGTYKLRLEKAVITADAYEADDTYENATHLAFGRPQSHTLHSGNDKDWYKFYADSENKYSLTASGDTELNGSWVYTPVYKEIFDTDGTTSLNVGGLYGDWTPPVDGVYYLLIDSGATQLVGEYSIELKRK